MKIHRRDFIERAAFYSAALTALSTACSKAEETPLNPGKMNSAAAIALPQFEKDGAYTLEHALQNRKTDRSFIKSDLKDKDMSRLLWAMTGVNRPDGHRTTPSAVASYPVDVYACLPGGAYMYDPGKHSLVPALSDDIRSSIPIQPGFKRAAMILVYVANVNKVPGGERTIRWADIEIGCMVQNVYLEAASMGLGACVFGLIRYGKVSGLLGLNEDKQLVRIAQAVGPIE